MPDFLPDTPKVREDIALYYDEIARMDSECGQVRGLLDRCDVAENTLVVFMGDNGMPFPRAKGSLYDPGIRVPTLACWPGRIKPGQATQALMSAIDLPITWLAMAGREPTEKMRGHSLLPLFDDPKAALRTAVFAERNWHNNAGSEPIGSHAALQAHLQRAAPIPVPAGLRPGALDKLAVVFGGSTQARRRRSQGPPLAVAGAEPTEHRVV